MSRFMELLLKILVAFQVSIQIAANGWGSGNFGQNQFQQPSRPVGPGQCCYCERTGCDIVNYPAYRRVPQVASADQCMSVCCGDNGMCQSTVYDTNQQICDLFDRSGYSYPADFTYRPGKSYYGLCPQCNCPNPRIVGPGAGNGTSPAAACPNNGKAYLIKTQNFSPSGSPSNTVPANSEQDCITACLGNQGGNCQAASYNSQSKQCAFFAQKTVDQQNPNFQPSPGATYYQKVCVPGTTQCNANNNLLDVYPKKILIGYVYAELTASSLQDCMLQCIQRGSECKSGHYYADQTSKNCLLKTESKNTRPDVWIDAGPNDQVTYFDNSCARTGLNFELRDFWNLH